MSNRVVGFNVDIGITNQNVFSEFSVSQDLGKQTAESILNLDGQINMANGKTIATQNVSLWNFYKQRNSMVSGPTLVLQQFRYLQALVHFQPERLL